MMAHWEKMKRKSKSIVSICVRMWLKKHEKIQLTQQHPWCLKSEEKSWKKSHSMPERSINNVTNYCLWLSTSSLQFNASLWFATSRLSSQLFQSIWYFLSFVSTLPSSSSSCTSSFRLMPLMCLRPSVRACLFICSSSISVDTSFLWFQRSPSLVHIFLSFQLLPYVCCQAVHFVISVLKLHLVYTPQWLRHSFPFTAYICCLNSFVATLSFHSLYPLLSFQLFLPFGRYFLFNSFI